MDYKTYHRDKTYQEEEYHFKNIFKKRYQIIINYKLLIKNSHALRVLDIGASTGTMLDIFHKAGFETWGVEPSESAKIAKDKGHKIINSYFENAKLQANYFDAVIMNHTLEHVDDPLKVLYKIYNILKKDGILLVDVPNAGGIASRILKDKWPYRLPEEHKSQFTRRLLSALFKKAGFKVIHFESRSGIFEFANPLKEIWESLIHGKRRFFTNILNIPYDIFVTILNSGDSMTVVGKK